MNELGIRKTHEKLKEKLANYIKAQYFAENDLLLEATETMLTKEGILFQEPYIEVTQNYKVEEAGFENADLDDNIKRYLNSLIDNKLGVFKTPFSHQVKSLEAYYKGKNLLVTTGTGSGKTECFLWPILTEMIRQASSSPDDWEEEGIRALILYPMNALVSDQMGRIRNIIGRKDDAYMNIMKHESKSDNIRRVRFGMYTGRTHYPGEEDSDKDKKLAKLLKKTYLNFENDEYKEKVYNKLEKIGKIPAKDLEKFVESLNKGNQKTGENDSELLTRTEMQKICPDILITNYSMLEYMLMRPIEKNFWIKTKKWLKRSNKNKFLLVIDEAHMYRGAAGGEVSLLIRRLIDKLEIELNQIKCILTSASIPEENDEELVKFACGLTGQSVEENNFVIIKGEQTKLKNNRKGKKSDVEKLLKLDYDKIQGNNKELKEQLFLLKNLFNWGEIGENYKSWLYKNLSQYPPMLELIKICNGKGIALKKIACKIFEGVNKKEGELATENLLALGTLAVSNEGKVLLPARVHLLFRGINGLYGCLNPNCKDSHNIMGIKLGHISQVPSLICSKCGSRVFELIGDRRCGTLFIRAFKENEEIGNGSFLWQERSKLINEPKEIHLWLAPENRNDIFKQGIKKSKAKEQSIFGYINSKTGILYQGEEFKGNEGFIRVLIPKEYNKEKKIYKFNTCPNCGREKNNPTPFKVKGNEPFANLIIEQLVNQPAKDTNLKNEGKKVLLFSDSRQKAATLARDLTIATDGDAGRQAIFLAQKMLDKIGKEDEMSLEMLYYAFLEIVSDNDISFFYGDEKEKFKEQIINYKSKFRKNKAINYNRIKDKIGPPPGMFYQLLLKNISDSYRSFNNLCLGQVMLLENGEYADELNDEVLENVQKATGLKIDVIRKIYNTWIQNILVKDIAIFPSISDEVRKNILAFEKGALGISEKEKFPKYIIDILKKNQITNEQIENLRVLFIKWLTLRGDKNSNNNRYLIPSYLTLKTCENSKWYKCRRCSGTSTFTLFNSCIYCGNENYLFEVSEKELKRYSFWRNPVIEVLHGKKIKNFITEEHTAQLSHKDQSNDVWSTTEEHEMRFRDIVINSNDEPIDILSSTTTMEVGIDIGSLTAIGLRNVPPMRENYQQRAGRAGRKGTAVSSIVTYTENGPHDAWYFNHPEQIISGKPRIPWIDYKNEKLINRHLNLVFLEKFCEEFSINIEKITVIDFFSKENSINYSNFILWINNKLPLTKEQEKVLISNEVTINWDKYKKDVYEELKKIEIKVNNNPILYKINKDEEDSYNSLLDILFKEGFLPTYSFPRDVVKFWIEKEDGKIKESPERSIDIALSEYAPGRMIVVNKNSYISGGLYDHYTKYNKDYKLKAAEPWLKINEYNKKIYCCEKNECGWFGLENRSGFCPLCNSKLIEKTLIKPWGFVARNGQKIPEVRDNQEYSLASKPSYASVYNDTSKMKKISKTGLIRMEGRKDQQLIIINKGPEEEGFDLCNKCGAIDPSITSEKDKKERKRPYKIAFMEKRDQQICVHTRQNVFLGYDILTDMLVLELKLEDENININDNLNIWIIPAVSTLSEALVLAASKVLDVEFSDLKSGFRLRYEEKIIYVDIYLYDSLSSGAGYANHVADLIDKVMDEIEIRLNECNCESSCPNCLEHFWNQSIKSNLDRKAGLQLLNWVRKGNLETYIGDEERDKYIDILKEIVYLQNNSYNIIKDKNSYWLENNKKRKRIEIYPAMCSLKQIKNKENLILIPDRLFKISLSDVWKLLEKQMI